MSKRRAIARLYRDPGFMQGLCAVCRKRQRDFNHRDYPSMCVGCRESRGKPFDMFNQVGNNAPPTRAMLEAKGFPLDVVDKILARESGAVQTLNALTNNEPPSEACQRFLAARAAVKKPIAI